MKQNFYEYSRDEEGQYRFTSRGKRTIVKIVGFTSTNDENIFNLWFGDLLPDDSIDDIAISNNGDMVKVLATVAQIAREFLFSKSVNVKLIFRGNTDQRTILYQRILKRYHAEFSSEFTISAFIRTDEKYEQVLFDIATTTEYWAFFIERKL